jgi:hypothetical protein
MESSMADVKDGRNDRRRRVHQHQDRPILRMPVLNALTTTAASGTRTIASGALLEVATVAKAVRASDLSHRMSHVSSGGAIVRIAPPLGCGHCCPGSSARLSDCGAHCCGGRIAETEQTSLRIGTRPFSAAAERGLVDRSVQIAGGVEVSRNPPSVRTLRETRGVLDLQRSFRGPSIGVGRSETHLRCGEVIAQMTTVDALDVTSPEQYPLPADHELRRSSNQQKIAGGRSNLTCRLSNSRHIWILRSRPNAGIKPSPHDVGCEFST